MGYIYQADVYCDDCGDAIRGQLQAQGLTPEDTMDHTSYDSDDFPKGADVENEESDSPQHCAKCSKFLRNPLTAAGYEYIQEKLNASGVTGPYELGKMNGKNPVLADWGGWYGFHYWDSEDCADHGRGRTPGWYSGEMSV